ncbi:aminoacyl-tRNA hydrolase [candidate division CSSED10-310 bacterium]|uniref:Peptidyl-tRNA hydrolase n=1 Tax=candidate division CSSED10-310 bacterium TaxID=2855610 RepID=A0ABV6YUT8_UNCC1
MVFAFIVGLGNPGPEYQHTRHSIGFLIIDYLSQRWRGKAFQAKGSALLCALKRPEGDILLIKPQLYMNRTGLVVGPLVKKYSCATEQLLIIHDDIDLPFGRIRIRGQGGSGGHKGVQSIIDVLQTDTFARIRVGIGRSSENDVSDHVLSEFTATEKKSLDLIIQHASLGAEAILSEGLISAMNTYNKPFLN